MSALWWCGKLALDLSNNEDGWPDKLAIATCKMIVITCVIYIYNKKQTQLLCSATEKFS